MDESEEQDESLPNAPPRQWERERQGAAASRHAAADACCNSNIDML